MDSVGLNENIMERWCPMVLRCFYGNFVALQCAGLTGIKWWFNEIDVQLSWCVLKLQWVWFMILITIVVIGVINQIWLGGATLRLWTFDQPPMTGVHRDSKSSGRCWKCFGKGWYTLAYSGSVRKWRMKSDRFLGSTWVRVHLIGVQGCAP